MCKRRVYLHGRCLLQRHTTKHNTHSDFSLFVNSYNLYRWAEEFLYNLLPPNTVSTGLVMSESRREINVLHWFRNKGLRLHDNPSLIEALKGAKSFRCVYILDPWFATASSQAGINKWRFLLQCLEDLDNSLRKVNSRLFVIRGQPTGVFPKLFKEWDITTLSYEEDPEPFARERDQAVSTLAGEANVEVVSSISHTLYPLHKIIKANNGQAPYTYRRFQNIIARMNPPEKPLESFTEGTIGQTLTKVSEDHDELYGIPTLESLGFDVEDLPAAVWKGGETEALARLVRHLERKAWVASFEKPKMTAQSLMASQTGLSPYLRFGCLSPRLFYWKLRDLYMKIKKQEQPSMSLYGQLLWREFFYTAATHNANFDRMVGNPICVQIPWDNKPEALAKWAEGKTGFPWIDAIMIQLRQEGWIHHLARHSVACFLTRGDLWITWEEGAKVFDELLLDADWSTNAGSWMWLSCSSFFQQFFHSYCPTNFGKATDPEGNYIRKYLPVLKGFPSKYIYEPWTAPQAVQQQAKCIIGKDYPVPMVNHAEASRINMQRMVQVYQQFKNGPLARRGDFKQIPLLKQGNKLSKIQFKPGKSSSHLQVTQGSKRSHSMSRMGGSGMKHFICAPSTSDQPSTKTDGSKHARYDQGTIHSFVKDLDNHSSEYF